MPLDNQRLIIEPTYPNGEGLAAIGKQEEKIDDSEGVTERNSWWSDRLGTDCYIWREADGRILGGAAPKMNGLMFNLDTLDCADAWGIEQESKAIQLLAEIVRHRQFKQYMLTGMFLETSKRSGVTYMFRRLKPTVALRATDKGLKVLCALCMHPIAYYANTWAGAMCPTDDVIAHLQMMRGDEVMLWRRSNQHPANRPQAGL